MADFLAIAGVSRTLRNLLEDRMVTVAPPIHVTIAPPDVAISNKTGKRANLYLYQITENGSLKNQEIPGQGHPADYGRPPLSIDLHYLITAHGSAETNEDADLEAQQILGDVMRIFHEFPMLTEALLQEKKPGKPPVLDPSLVGEFERIKITFQPSTLEDFSKIWTALPESNFRRSVTYQISVVQIESRRPRHSVLPVRERAIYAFPFNSPRITEIVRETPFADGMPPSAVAEVGDTVLILGDNLAGDATRVRIGEVNVPVPAPQATRIALVLPNTVSAGLHSVQVIHDLMLKGEPGQPLVPHRGFRSNALPLLVLPRLSGIAPAAAAPGDLVTVTVDPPARARQEKVLLLGDFAVPAMPVAVTDPPSPTVQFRLPPVGPDRIPANPYLARIRIDGAESRLTFDGLTKKYNGPNFTVNP